VALGTSKETSKFCVNLPEGDIDDCPWFCDEPLAMKGIFVDYHRRDWKPSSLGRTSLNWDQHTRSEYTIEHPVGRFLAVFDPLKVTVPSSNFLFGR
jgi:hypothetical protein